MLHALPLRDWDRSEGSYPDCMGDNAKCSAIECRAIITHFLVTLKTFLSSHSRK